MRIFPVLGRKVALHVEHLAALRSGEDRAVGGHDGFVDVVGRGIAASGQKFAVDGARSQVDGSDVAGFSAEVGQRLVVADGKTRIVDHRAAQCDFGDLRAGFGVEEDGVGGRADEQFVREDQQAAALGAGGIGPDFRSRRSVDAERVARGVADVNDGAGGVDGRRAALHGASLGEGPLQLAFGGHGIELSGAGRSVIDVAGDGVHREHVVAVRLGRRDVTPLLAACGQVEGVQARHLVERDDVDGFPVGREYRTGAFEAVVVRAVLRPVGAVNDVFADLDLEVPGPYVAVDGRAQFHGLRADRSEAVFDDRALLDDIARESPFDIGGCRVIRGVEREGDGLILGCLVAVEAVRDGLGRHGLDGGRFGGSLGIVGH